MNKPPSYEVSMATEKDLQSELPSYDRIDNKKNSFSLSNLCGFRRKEPKQLTPTERAELANKIKKDKEFDAVYFPLLKEYNENVQSAYEKINDYADTGKYEIEIMRYTYDKQVKFHSDNNYYNCEPDPYYYLHVRALDKIKDEMNKIYKKNKKMKGIYLCLNSGNEKIRDLCEKYYQGKLYYTLCFNWKPPV